MVDTLTNELFAKLCLGNKWVIDTYKSAMKVKLVKINRKNGLQLVHVKCVPTDKKDPLFISIADAMEEFGMILSETEFSSFSSFSSDIKLRIRILATLTVLIRTVDGQQDEQGNKKFSNLLINELYLYMLNIVVNVIDLLDGLQDDKLAFKKSKNNIVRFFISQVLLVSYAEQEASADAKQGRDTSSNAALVKVFNTEQPVADDMLGQYGGDATDTPRDGFDLPITLGDTQRIMLAELHTYFNNELVLEISYFRNIMGGCLFYFNGGWFNSDYEHIELPDINEFKVLFKGTFDEIPTQLSATNKNLDNLNLTLDQLGKNVERGGIIIAGSVVAVTASIVIKQLFKKYKTMYPTV